MGAVVVLVLVLVVVLVVLAVVASLEARGVVLTEALSSVVEVRSIAVEVLSVFGDAGGSKEFVDQTNEIRTTSSVGRLKEHG